MKRTPIARHTPLRHTRPVKRRNAKRHASEWQRVYHSRARVRWVKGEPCIVHGDACPGPIENAHTETGGTSRKAGYETIVPLCESLHRLLHRIGAVSFQHDYRLDLTAEAARTHARWLAATGGEA